MAKISLTNIEKVDTSKTALNQNFTAIEQEFQNKVLYRDNPVGEPNSMATDLDMDSNDILNVGNIDVQSLTANGKTLDEYLAEVSANGLATKAELEAVKTELEGGIATKQDTLVSGTSIKTVNGTSLLGSGNVVISASTNWGSIGGTLADQTDLNTALNTKQPLDAQLTDVAGLTPADGSFIIGNGTNFITESGSTARASLGLGTAATSNTGDFATAAQGALASSALQPSTIGTTVQGYDADTAKTDVAQNWVAQGQLIGTVANGGVTIASNTITLDMGAYNSFDLGVFPAGTYTFAQPTGLQAGVSFKGDIRFTNPSSGIVSFVYNAVFDFLNGTAPTINTTANANLFFEYSTFGTGLVRLSGGNRWA